MLDIFTDNWDNPPVLNDGERMLRILTDNPVNELYVIVDDSIDDDELHEEILFALRHKFGTSAEYGGFEDASYICEEAKEIEAIADEGWDGEGYYSIGWSDGGEDWTNNGPVWFDRKDDLEVEVAAAYDNRTDTHLPYAEKVVVFGNYNDGGFEAMFGEFMGDYDMDGILEDIDEATRPTADGKSRYWVGLTTPEEGQEELNKILEENLKK